MIKKIVKRRWRVKLTAFFTLLIILSNSCNSIAHAQSITSPPTDTCGRWRGWMGVRPNTQDEFKMQRDTLTRYIESCAGSDDSYQVFPSLTSAISRYNEEDTNRFNQYRTWLLSVVYLNTSSPYYFCSCVEAMISTYQYGPYKKANSSLAILKFLLDHPNCNNVGYQDFYNNNIKYRHEQWLLKRIMTGDTTIIEDTVIPSLDSIGLGILLHHNAVSPSKTLSPTYLASLTSSPNPFISETKLRFHLNRMSYVTVEISDLLGRVVWQSKGRTYDIGDHELTIDGKSIPDGTLYARISTGFGEVKTVKLVKQ